MEGGGAEAKGSGPLQLSLSFSLSLHLSQQTHSNAPPTPTHTAHNDRDISGILSKEVRGWKTCPTVAAITQQMVAKLCTSSQSVFCCRGEEAIVTHVKRFNTKLLKLGL